MERKEYLSEENYEKGKKKISGIALIILIGGLLIGGSLIALGVVNVNKVNSKYSDESKTKLTEQLNDEKEELEKRKKELESKGLTYDAFTEYTDGESYELKIIAKALDPSFDNCKFEEYKNNTTTSKYCSLKSQLEDIDSDFNKSFDSNKYIPLFMFGAFIIIGTFMFAGVIYMITKRREITAFTAQQVMPIAQEGMEKMAPTLGKVSGEIAKGMAPVYGEVAKEIAKGVKEGLKDEEK